MIKEKVLFYSPFGTGLPDYKLGGAEQGARRIKKMLEEEGYDVTIIEKPYREYGIIKFIQMTTKALIKAVIFFSKNKGSLLYEVAFYDKNIFTEWLMGKIAKKTHSMFLYEPKNGRMVNTYYEKGLIYRYFMSSTLRTADLIFAQGIEYVDFIKKNVNKDAIYVPNFVMKDKIKSYNKERTMNTINLIYVGRVTETKRIDVSLSILSSLIKKGVDANLTIVGGYEENYKRKLDAQIEENNLASKVRFTGRKNFEFIRNQLLESHFFLFPSAEKDEGHSNSLTEAMTFGVVPIVSTAGFNSSIVDDNSLVIKDLDSEKYADAITRILKNNLWEEYSKKMSERVRAKYSEDVVKEAVLSSIEDLMKRRRSGDESIKK